MTNFDLEEINEFAADLNTQLAQCDSSEGAGSVTLDAQLRQYASATNKLYDEIRDWRRAVFKAKVKFDPNVEKVFLDQAHQIQTRSLELLAQWERTQKPSEELDARHLLRSALFGLQKLLSRWRSPQRSVAPGPRLGLPTEGPAADEIRRRLASLPYVPINWDEGDPEQKKRYEQALAKRAKRQKKAE